MISFLIRFFIKDTDNSSMANNREKYGIICGFTGIFLNLLLFTGKFITGLISNSIAITADAFNNLSDAGSSVITLLGFKIAGKKPDPEHPFGHGRVEYISGLFVSIAIVLMGYELTKSSFTKILHPENTTFNIYVLLVLVCSILVKFYMSYYNRKIGTKINSAAMSATATDSLSDVIATSAVLASNIITYFFHVRIDGYCGLLVGCFILFAGFRAAKDTLGPLLGQPPTPEFVDQIKAIVMSHENILGLHDLIVHDYGPGRVMISLHAEVPASGNILELHDTIDIIEHELSSHLECMAVIHMDPIMNDDKDTLLLKDKVNEIIHLLDESITFHDFRLVKGPTHTNVIFDIAIPFNFRLNDTEIFAHIDGKIKEINENYYTIIQIDKVYS